MRFEPTTCWYICSKHLKMTKNKYSRYLLTFPKLITFLLHAMYVVRNRIIIATLYWVYCTYCKHVLCFLHCSFFTCYDHVVMFFLLLQILMSALTILVTTLVPTMSVHLCVGVIQDID